MIGPIRTLRPEPPVRRFLRMFGECPRIGCEPIDSSHADVIPLELQELLALRAVADEEIRPAPAQQFIQWTGPDHGHGSDRGDRPVLGTAQRMCADHRCRGTVSDLLSGGQLPVSGDRRR